MRIPFFMFLHSKFDLKRYKSMKEINYCKGICCATCNEIQLLKAEGSPLDSGINICMLCHYLTSQPVLEQSWENVRICWEVGYWSIYFLFEWKILWEVPTHVCFATVNVIWSINVGIFLRGNMLDLTGYVWCILWLCHWNFNKI